MKKIGLVILAALVLAGGLMVGCGSPKKEGAKFEGSQAVNNYVAQGMQYLSEKNIPLAIQSFDQAIKEDPTRPENYIILGQVYLALKNYAKAVDTFTAATRVAPTNAGLFYILAEIQTLRGERDLAIEAARKSVELFAAQKDEEKFKKAVVLLKSLMDSPLPTPEASAAPAAAK